MVGLLTKNENTSYDLGQITLNKVAYRKIERRTWIFIIFQLIDRNSGIGARSCARNFLKRLCNEKQGHWQMRSKK